MAAFCPMVKEPSAVNRMVNGSIPLRRPNFALMVLMAAS